MKILTKKLIALRQDTPNATVNAATSPIEKFQNITLRPILKGQHQHYIWLLQKIFEHNKNHFFGLKRDPKKAYIESIFQKDRTLRTTLIGRVISWLTEEELLAYKVNEKEYNKRIIQMIKQRMTSSIYDFTPPTT